LRISKRIRIIIVVVVSLAILSYSLRFASATSPATSNGPVINVSIHDYSFDPKSITLDSPNTTSGEFVTVVWTNDGSVSHTVTSGNGTTGTPDGLFDSGTLAPGQTFTLQVNQTMYARILAKYPDGTVPYYCKFHYSLGMVGEMTVSPTPVPEFPSFFILALFMIATLLTIVVLKRKSIKVEEMANLKR
jgi:plastocyanin